VGLGGRGARCGECVCVLGRRARRCVGGVTSCGRSADAKPRAPPACANREGSCQDRGAAATAQAPEPPLGRRSRPTPAKSRATRGPRLSGPSRRVKGKSPPATCQAAAQHFAHDRPSALVEPATQGTRGRPRLLCQGSVVTAPIQPPRIRQHLPEGRGPTRRPILAPVPRGRAPPSRR